MGATAALCMVAWGVMGITRFPINFAVIDKPTLPPVQVNSERGHMDLPSPLNITVMFVDSSRNQYTFWPQIPDPIHYSENGDTVVFVWRGYEIDGTGLIAIAMTIDEGNTWYVLRRINEYEISSEGSARYPSASLQGGHAVAGFPEITSGIWFYGANVSGPFTTDTSQWCGDTTPGINVHKFIPMRLSDNIHVLNLGSSVSQGFVCSKYHVMDCVMESTYVVDPGFALLGGDYLGDTVMAFGFNSQGHLAAYVYDAEIDQWLGQIPLQEPGIDTLSDGEVLSFLGWADGIILNDGTPLMITGMWDGSGIDTVLAGRSLWALTPDTAVRIWIAPNPDPIHHVIYSQLSVDRLTGTVYAFWEKLDDWRGDTTGYGSWDIWCSFSTDNGHSWSEPVNLTNTQGVDEALFQVAKRVVDGRTWIGFLRPTGGRVEDLYYHIMVGGGIFVSKVFLGYVEGLGVNETFQNPPRPEIILQNNALFINSRTSGILSIEIIDVAGRVVKSLSQPISRGRNVIHLPVTALTTGIYFLKADLGQGKPAIFKFIHIQP